MACGLPCVDVAGGSPEASLRARRAVRAAEPDPVALADAVERLLDDGELWRRRSEAGLEFVRRGLGRRRTQVEAGLREALAGARPRRPSAVEARDHEQLREQAVYGGEADEHRAGGPAEAAPGA